MILRHLLTVFINIIFKLIEFKLYFRNLVRTIEQTITYHHTITIISFRLNHLEA